MYFFQLIINWSDMKALYNIIFMFLKTFFVGLRLISRTEEGQYWTLVVLQKILYFIMRMRWFLETHTCWCKQIVVCSFKWTKKGGVRQTRFCRSFLVVINSVKRLSKICLDQIWHSAFLRQFKDTFGSNDVTAAGL